MKSDLHLDKQLALRIATNLQSFDARAIVGSTHKAAAVVVAVTDAGYGANLAGLPTATQWSQEGALIVTKRSQRLRRHPGQWALPGGRIDSGESPEAAAIRELSEEVGLDADASQIIGRLDDIETKSGYVMTPIVTLVGPARNMQANPDEVQSIHRVPVSELLRTDAPLLNHVAGNPYPELRMPIGDSWIAAPTAAVLYQFAEVCIRGNPTRVAHFEQPKFTWR